MKIRTFFISLALTGLALSAASQDRWRLRKNRNGIQAYSAEFPGSEIRAIKVVSTFNATPAQIAAKVMDINASIDWVVAHKIHLL